MRLYAMDMRKGYVDLCPLFKAAGYGCWQIARG
ncbi:hypothetical protein SME13J_02680 [Serratia marcescens]|nr:hypothetical protein SME13J_02680 [Serratia marcescens]